MAKKDKKVIDVMGEKTIAYEESYLNNPNLPKKDSQYVYTDEMLKEIAKCKEDIIYFAEHHFYVNGINGKKIIKLFDKQRKILGTIQHSKKTLLVSSRQWGKCLSGPVKVGVKIKWLPWSFSIPVGKLYFLVKILTMPRQIIKKAFNIFRKK